VAEPLYAGITGNGRAVHLSLVACGRAVAALCGATVWTNVIPIGASMPDGVCKRCERAAR
jgi:hypothetical protein